MLTGGGGRLFGGDLESVSFAQERLSELRKRHRERQERFDFSYRKAVEEMLALLLPDLEAATIETFKTRSGIEIDPGLADEMAADRAECLRELEAIEGHPLYLSKDRTLAPTTGELDSDLAELRLHHQALQPVLKTCFKHPRFPELLESGYGTKQYKKRFWRMAYHVDRAAAKEIEEACGGRPFSEIRADVISALEASSILDQRIKSLQKKRKEIEELCARRSKLKKRLRRHEQIWLTSSHWQIRRELESRPDHYFEKLQAEERWSDEVARWRLLAELCREHQQIKLDFLSEAAQALVDDNVRHATRLMDEYEDRERSLSRFDGPSASKKRVDWKAFLYSQ